jgi:two-component system, NtrC family, C4-dicarboxylate transport sensor histidine kinase DctB
MNYTPEPALNHTAGSSVKLLGYSGLFWMMALIITSLAVTVLWQTASLTRERAMARMLAQGQQQLELHTANLRGQLGKFEHLPELLAANRWLVDLLDDPSDQDRVDALNRYLETANSIAGASDTYLMDPSGLTIAASNWNSERPFVGRNFSYRPYFQEAMRGNLGRYFALGTTSNKRGFYFAYPVRKQEQILGAVVIKLNLAEIEQTWARSENEFIVTDPDGVVFLTTNKDWRFKTLQPVAYEARSRIARSRRYAGMEFTPLSVRPGKRLADAASLIRIQVPATGSYLIQERAMPEAGWKVHILTPTAPINAEVMQAVFLATVLLVVAILFFQLWNQRRRRSRDRLRYQQEAHALLESRVKERTRDLTEANTQLIQEIDERQRAEEALMQARDDLIQATKLAALGEMSTSISHELNQPLAAIRAYADNARALIDHGRQSDALGNLTQISDLTERMAQISAQLKIFARRDSSQAVSVSLDAAIDNGLRILKPGINEDDIEIRLNPGGREILVLANSVQLDQVLVNLIDNALHAVEGGDKGMIDITAGVNDGEAILHIRDNGAGIKEDALPRIFDPFFTTKEEGRGLGLGLSISYRMVEGMGGRLEAANHPDGGAVFTLHLPLAEDAEEDMTLPGGSSPVEESYGRD